jgi:hypothetical protein
MVCVRSQGSNFRLADHAGVISYLPQVGGHTAMILGRHARVRAVVR